MKIIKLFAASAMLAICSVANAQDVTTAISNFEKVVERNNGNPNAYKKELKDLDKLCKKDPQALAKLAKVFYVYDDTMNARIYAEKSIMLVEKKKMRFCDPYITMGDIYYVNGDPGEAAGWYERAKLNDDRNPKAYEKVAGVYRKANPAASVEQLKELEALDPTYPANAVAAGFYYDAAIAGQKTWGRTLQYFEKEDVNKLREEDYPRYVYVLFLYKKYEKCVDIATRGLSQFPEDVTCNRYLMYSLQSLGKNAEAVSAANKMFTCPKYQDYADDYRVLGQAYVGVKDFAKAEENLNKSVSLKEDQPEILKALSEVAYAKGDTIQGLNYIEQYIEKYDQVDLTDYYDLTKRYDDLVKATPEGEAKVALAQKEDGIFATMLEKFPGKLLVYIYYKRATLHTIIDETGVAAVPYYEQLVEAALAEDAVKHKATINQVAKKLSEYYKAAENTEKAEKYAAIITE